MNSETTESSKKNHKNPNNPERFVGKDAAIKGGETADIHNKLSIAVWGCMVV